MARLFRPLLLVALVLAVPIIPFLLAGDWFDAHVEQWLFHPAQSDPPSRAVIAGGVVALLAGDFLLPVPSGPLSTWAGGQLGIVMGTAVVWTGMSLGAVIAFGLAKRFGAPIVARSARGDDLRNMERLTAQYGSLTLVLARGIPVLAEASVLLLGAQGLAWSRFLAPVLLANLGIALAFTALGDWAGQHEWLPAAIGISIALPVVVGLAARRGIARWEAKATSTSVEATP